MNYDPMAHGAQCKACPLYGLPVVPPEGDPGAAIAFVAQNPGKTEEQTRRPLDPSAPSGGLYTATLKLNGLQRSSVWTTNAILCRPRNAFGKDAEPPTLAIQACRPRLMRELKGKKVLVLMGDKAVRSVAPDKFRTWQGHPRKITSIAGYPEKLTEGPLAGILAIPIVHPAFVKRPQGRPYLELFAMAFKKAKRLLDARAAGTELAVPDPPVASISTIGRLRALHMHVVSQPNPSLIVDVETTKDHPLSALLKCIGITCLCCDKTWVIRWLRGSDLLQHWSKADLPIATRLIREILNK